MRHVHAVDHPICEPTSSIEMIGEATCAIYASVDCTDCLRRAIAESEERTRVLHDLLAKVEDAS